MTISEQLLKQRIRTLQIGAMANLSSAQEMAKLGIFETFETWHDVYQTKRESWYDAPVYSVEEQQALRSVDLAVDKVSGTIASDSWAPDVIAKVPGLAAVFAAATVGCRVFSKRGSFDPDKEEPIEVLVQ